MDVPVLMVKMKTNPSGNESIAIDEQLVKQGELFDANFTSKFCEVRDKFVFSVERIMGISIEQTPPK